MRTTDYSQKVKVGPKTLTDVSLNLGSLKQYGPKLPITNKGEIYQALAYKEHGKLRMISDFFYQTNGIYQRVCDYFAFLYRFDWYLMPEINDSSANSTKVLKEFSKILTFLDNSYLKKVCGDIALEVVKYGCYYGYMTFSKQGLIIQQLPIQYCRSRYKVGTRPAVEFNMRFFDTIPDVNYRMKVLDLFPDEFKKGYYLFKKGKLPSDVLGEIGGWYLLDIDSCVKFNFNGGDTPLFVNAIPNLIDLDAAQDLDRRKQMQQLLKILVQKLPMDKNGDLIFDIDEAQDIHNNAVQMLKRTIGVDILTTFADIEPIDVSDTRTTTAQDDLERVERTVYNSFGVSNSLFNTNSNLALEKSILNDEATIRNLLVQFEIFFNAIVQKISSKNSKYGFRFYMLETTQYNYKEISKMYKEQTQLGFSKLLPQIALGHSQSFILNSITFENEFLNLSEIMIPPMNSNTLSSSDLLDKKSKTSTNKTQISTEDNKGGRPEKSDDQKSEKTIQNRESMS